MTIADVLNKAIQVEESKERTFTLLKLDETASYPVGPIFKGENRYYEADLFKQHLEECLWVLHRQLKRSESLDNLVELVDRAVLLVEDGEEVLLFLKLNGKTFAIGSIFSGELRLQQAKTEKENIQECFYNFHQQLIKAET